MAVKLEPGCIIEDADLSGVDFAEIDHAGATLTQCILRDVQFTGTCLQDARLTQVRLIRCRFANVDMRDAIFEDCSFIDDAGHTGAQFAFSRLDQARFRRCELSFAKIDRSTLFGVEFDACNMRGAEFHKADFSRTFGRKLVKTAATLRGCNLEFADLNGVRMPDCELSNSNFREAVLFDSDLEGADLRGSDLVLALTAGAKFARADLRGADVADLNLRELATLEGMIVSAGQQPHLLAAMGLDVYPD